MAALLLAALAGLVVGRLLAAGVAGLPAGVPAGEALGARPGCDCRAGGRDYIPVVWWIAGRDGCRRCGSPSGVTLPLVELVTAGVFVGAVHFVGIAWSLPAYLWFAAVTVVLSFIDLGHRLIPNRIVLPGILVGLALLAGGAAPEGRLVDVAEAVATGAGYFAVMLVAALLTGGAIGMGDVKLAFLLGMFAGYGGWEVAVPAGAGAFLLAGLAAVILLALRKLSRNDHVPFGPFMVAGAWIAIARDLATGMAPV